MAFTAAKSVNTRSKPPRPAWPIVISATPADTEMSAAISHVLLSGLDDIGRLLVLIVRQPHFRDIAFMPQLLTAQAWLVWGWFVARQNPNMAVSAWRICFYVYHVIASSNKVASSPVLFMLFTVFFTSARIASITASRTASRIALAATSAMIAV